MVGSNSSIHNRTPAQKPVVYAVGPYAPVAANGVTRILYVYSQMLAGGFNVVSLTLDDLDGYEVVNEEVIMIHKFGKRTTRGFWLPRRLQSWLTVFGMSIPPTLRLRRPFFKVGAAQSGSTAYFLKLISWDTPNEFMSDRRRTRFLLMPMQRCVIGRVPSTSRTTRQTRSKGKS